MQNYKKIYEILDNEACKQLINKLLPLPPAQVALQYSGKLPCDAQALAELIYLYQKAETKLPLWPQKFCALTRKSFEQATAQEVALYKSTFIKGKKLLVLGAGLGVDEWAFSKTFETVVSVDNDADLNEMAAYNHEKLEVNNISRITASAEEHLETATGSFDCIYTDPDRRDEKGRRKITLADSTPPIVALQPRIREISPRLVIKASPLLDISAAQKELYDVEEIRVIAYRNEVKEVLISTRAGYTGKPAIVAANYESATGWQEYRPASNGLPAEAKPENMQYFFEPNVAILKAGLQQDYAAHCGLHLLDAQTAYYTGPMPIDGFMGRCLRIVAYFPFSKKGVKTYLAGNKIEKANVARRNFRLSPEEIKQVFKIKDGGEDYLFFTRKKGEDHVFHCRYEVAAGAFTHNG